MRTMVAGLFAAAALLLFASCAGTTTSIGLTTNQAAYAEEKNPR